MRLFKVGQRGHVHIIGPLLVMIAVGVIGTSVYNAYSHANSLPCTSRTFTASTKPDKCVQYLQQMLNGNYATSVGTDTGNNIKGLNIDPAYGRLKHGAYKSNLLLVKKQFGHVSSVYDSPTTNQVFIYQTSSLNPRLPKATGIVDHATWRQLCVDSVTLQLASDGSTLRVRDVSVHTHTPAGYADSYRRAGVSAGEAAGCAAPLKHVAPTATSYNECQEVGGKQAIAAHNESCTFNGKKFTVASDAVFAAWGHVKSTTVNLQKWKVTFAVPKSLVGNLNYQVDPGENIYDFNTTKMFAPACVDYFNQRNQEASVEFDQYVQSKAAKTLVSNGGSMNLDQYYKAHKASGGNYFLDNHGRKVWKIGRHFYEFLTDTSAYHGSAFAKACPGVSAQYQTLLAATVPTVKEY